MTKYVHPSFFFAFVCTLFLGFQSVEGNVPQSIASEKNFGITRNITLEKNHLFSRRAYALHYKGKLLGFFEPTLEKSDTFSMASQSARDWFTLYFYPTFSDVKKALETIKEKSSKKEWPVTTSGDPKLADADLAPVKQGWVRRAWHWISSFFEKKVDLTLPIRGHHGVEDKLLMRFIVNPEVLETEGATWKKEAISALEGLVSSVDGLAERSVEKTRHLYESYVVPETFHSQEHRVHIHQHEVKTLHSFADAVHVHLKHSQQCFRCFEGLEKKK